MIFMNNLIDLIDDNGNKLIDNYIIPIAKGTKKIIEEENLAIKSLITLRSTMMEYKISQFINYIRDNENDIVYFIQNLNNKEKKYFIETINKVMDLDEVFQIYLLSVLLDKFNKNGSLNYWEKSIYYNIKSFSEDDFFILFSFMKSLAKPIQHKVNYGISQDSKDELIICIKKFESVGVISLCSDTFLAECVNLKLNEQYRMAFSFYPFIDELFEVIKNYKLNDKDNSS